MHPLLSPAYLREKFRGCLTNIDLRFTGDSFMKAIAVTPATKTLDIIDLPEPEISSPSDVKLRMLKAVFAAPTERSVGSSTAPRHKARRS
jgi:hypothetical protein